MAGMGPVDRYRRWRRKRLTHAPTRWLEGIKTLGVALLVIGALLITIYVTRLK